jgi:hypothetical protein
MAETADQGRQDGWSEGIDKLTEAARQNINATNLAYAGAVALGAAAFAYFWDPARRNAFLEGSRRWSEDLTSFWNSRTSAAPSVNQ